MNQQMEGRVQGSEGPFCWLVICFDHLHDVRRPASDRRVFWLMHMVKRKHTLINLLIPRKEVWKWAHWANLEGPFGNSVGSSEGAEQQFFHALFVAPFSFARKDLTKPYVHSANSILKQTAYHCCWGCLCFCQFGDICQQPFTLCLFPKEWVNRSGPELPGEIFLQ